MSDYWSAEQCSHYAFVKANYRSMPKLNDTLPGRNVRIPSGGAYVIIGGRGSIFASLNMFAGTKTRFLAQDGKPLVVTAYRAGSRAGIAIRTTAKKALALSVLPIAPAVGYVQAGFTTKNFTKMFSNYKRAILHPAQSTEQVKAVSYTIVQVASQAAAGDANEIENLKSSSLYVNNLLNILLGYNVIANVGNTRYTEEEEMEMEAMAGSREINF